MLLKYGYAQETRGQNPTPSSEDTILTSRVNQTGGRPSRLYPDPDEVAGKKTLDEVVGAGSLFSRAALEQIREPERPPDPARPAA